MNETKNKISPARIEIKSRIRKTVISLWLNGYDDFFSDFDPRPYSHRALSDDFVNEAKKVAREMKPGFSDISFLVPANLRDRAMEKIIMARLHSHFRKEFHHLRKERKNIMKKGLMLTLLGMAIIFADSVATHNIANEYLSNLVRIVLEPSGWFITWYGLDHIFYLSKENRHELEFNRKMSHAEIRFDAYKPLSV